MNPGPSFAINGGTMPLSAVYQQSKNRAWSTWWGWKNSARSSPVPRPFACPPFLLRVPLNNQLEKTFTHSESKQTRQPYTEELLSLCQSPRPLNTTSANSHLIFWAVQGGLGHPLGGGRHLGGAGRNDSAAPCSESIFTQGPWAWGRDSLPLGTHSHPPEQGNKSHEPERLLAAFSWDHALFFFKAAFWTQTGTLWLCLFFLPFFFFF